MINEKEKSIYNSFLYASRKAKNKPVRLRQNFDNLESKDEVALKKLNLLLSKYTHINYSDFFIAPYKVYGSDNYFDLTFFNLVAALISVTLSSAFAFFVSTKPRTVSAATPSKGFGNFFI